MGENKSPHPSGQAVEEGSHTETQTKTSEQETSVLEVGNGRGSMYISRRHLQSPFNFVIQYTLDCTSPPIPGTTWILSFGKAMISLFCRIVFYANTLPHVHVHTVLHMHPHVHTCSLLLPMRILQVLQSKKKSNKISHHSILSYPIFQPMLKFCS